MAHVKKSDEESSFFKAVISHKKGCPEHHTVNAGTRMY